MANKNLNTNRTYTLAELKALADIPANRDREFFHALWETGKKHLSRDEQTLLWEHLKGCGVKAFAGRKWRKDHPDEGASEMPSYITEAQEKRKAEKAAQPKAEKAPAKKPAAKKPASKKAAAKQPETPTDVNDALARIFAEMQKIDQRLTAIEKMLDK